MSLRIPRDTSKPVGDAVDKDGNLLSASKLTFVNSPSDEIPALPLTKDKTAPGPKKDNDKDYRPPKRSQALDEEVPENIFDSNSEEVVVETEKGQKIVRV